MSKHPVLSLRKASISFAKKILFENLDLHLFARDRVCLIGKNGVGKTTLLNALAGTFELDINQRFQMPNTILGYLQQNEKIPHGLSVEDYITQKLALDEHKKYLIDIVCSNLKIDKNLSTANLSGGQIRRVNLAYALIHEPDILLLDEPTNHLDIEIIEWLENYLQNFQGALIIISHDRKFLEKTSNKVFWIRAGQIKVNNQGYKNFDEWSQNIIDFENRELENLQKKVELESSWLQTGVTARRKRNIGRLHHLKELQSKLSSQRKIVNANQSQIKLVNPEFEEDSPQLIMNLNNVSFHFENNSQNKIIDKLNLRIIRQERIGIIGKNGAGKSTFLKLIVNEIKPVSGNIKMARDIKFSYFDQSRSLLNSTKTMQEILCDSGSDYVQLANNKTRHICGYLRDFAFNPDDRFTQVSTLSGGQQNRLLLAKTLANPGNFMILDEPTNDLDMDSLDILQDYLQEYQGTLLVVSHDRDFLDNVATSILAFEGQAIITNHYGGYSDYLSLKEKNNPLNNKSFNKNSQLSNNNNYLRNNYDLINSDDSQYLKTQHNVRSIAIPTHKTENEFSYKMSLELTKTTEKISQLTQKIQQLNDELLNGDNYNPIDFANISTELANYTTQLEKLENRWLELEEIKEKSSK
ncbi:MAG: ABC-F family ATP-binding cassette domain-containing protein [Alphaproteobacteria bacterium]